jgi:hypothetical protein
VGLHLQAAGWRIKQTLAPRVKAKFLRRFGIRLSGNKELAPIPDATGKMYFLEVAS